MPITPAVRARRHGLADLLARSAVRTPDKTAIVYGDLRQSYADLDALVLRTAAGLATRGVTKGDRVVLLARNSHGFAVAYFALARLGAI
ncbi:MAG: AMP-binding protein, partial [Streptomycetaceae bacterium]|nr:AMP-binding protein [Streptomycetaceae bacterium]